MSADKLKQIFQKQKDQKDVKNVELENIIQLVGFMVGEEEFAVPILSIQEIIKPIEYTRVPSAPSYVLGVFNLRGNVIPLIDLRLKFSLPSKKQTDDTRYIVMKNSDEIAGFVIDRLTEAVRIKENDIDEAPNSSTDKNMIYGIGKRADRILTILNTEALLRREF